MKIKWQLPKQCKKVSYKTRQNAWKAAIRFKELYGTEQAAYICFRKDLKKHFHLTSHAPMTPPKKLLNL